MSREWQFEMSSRELASSRDSNLAQQESQEQKIGRSSNGPPSRGSRVESRYWKTVLGRSCESDNVAMQDTPNSSETILPPLSVLQFETNVYPWPWEMLPRNKEPHRTGSKQAARHFLCPRCPSSFERRGHLQSHIDTVHDRKRLFPCPEGCGKVFGHRSSLSRHIRTAHDPPQI